ncbi:29731_t:CDS:2 [Gigaspora margarita]|uniref:29731_t:CDS:1 n=1 Tax=Gigaspora margarita TaxID=4874 RepID=A0ABN7UKJ1_GIGMA|nr:29731_t:CDS:2 [Gigaspora margarita]
MKTNSINSSNSKLGRPPTEFYSHNKLTTLHTHLANSYKKVSKKWQHHFNYTLVNNLEDIPTDEPIYSVPNTTSSLAK